jgi:hypothetical protein
MLECRKEKIYLCHDVDNDMLEKFFYFQPISKRDIRKKRNKQMFHYHSQTIDIRDAVIYGLKYMP